MIRARYDSRRDRVKIVEDYGYPKSRAIDAMWFDVDVLPRDYRSRWSSRRDDFTENR